MSHRWSDSIIIFDYPVGQRRTWLWPDGFDEPQFLAFCALCDQGMIPSQAEGSVRALSS